MDDEQSSRCAVYGFDKTPAPWCCAVGARGALGALPDQLSARLTCSNNDRKDRPRIAPAHSPAPYAASSRRRPIAKRTGSRMGWRRRHSIIVSAAAATSSDRRMREENSAQTAAAGHQWRSRRCISWARLAETPRSVSSLAVRHELSLPLNDLDRRHVIAPESNDIAGNDQRRWASAATAVAAPIGVSTAGATLEP